MVVHCLDGRKLIYGMQFERIATAVVSSFELLGSLFFFFCFFKSFYSIMFCTHSLQQDTLLNPSAGETVNTTTSTVCRLILMYANLKELLWLLPLCAIEGVCLFAFVKTSIVLCFSVPIRFKQGEGASAGVTQLIQPPVRYVGVYTSS